MGPGGRLPAVRRGGQAHGRHGRRRMRRLPQPLKRRPQWGHRVTLFQLRQPAFWFYLGFLSLAGVLTLLQQGTFLAMAPVGWLLSWLLLALYAVPVFLLLPRPVREAAPLA